MENEVKEQSKKKKVVALLIVLGAFILLILIFCLSKWVCNILALPKKIPTISMWLCGMEVDNWIAVSSIILMIMFMIWLLYRNHRDK